MPEITSVHDLHVLRPEDLEKYNNYVKNSSCPVNCWWGQFPYFWGYSFKKRRKSLWAIVDYLFVPFLFSGRYLSLLTVPFGKGTPEEYIAVLKKCLNFCSRHNADNQPLTHVRWVTEDQIKFLQHSSDFDYLFDAQELTLGPEYHYSVQALLKLEGKEFANVRYKRNKFLKRYPDIVIREYLSSDYPQVMELNDKWLTGAQQRYSSIFDKAYYPAFLKDHLKFDHIILVALHENLIIGMIAGSVTPNEQSYCFLRKAMHEYDGLSQILLLSLVKAIHEKNSNVQLLNDGGTGLHNGMAAFKERFRPRKKVNRYRVTMNSLKILHQQSYKGPSIVGFSPSARLILENKPPDLFKKISSQTIEHLKALLTTALGSDAEDLQLTLEKSPAQIIAQIAVIIQQASRHPVSHYGARQISPGIVEISFELLRPALLDPLVECIQAFWQSGFLHFDANLFIDQYQLHRKFFGFTLSEYIVQERIRTAQRLGIEAKPDQGFRTWLGRGHQSRLISLGYTQNTPRLGKTIASDKSLSFSYMSKKGLPVPEQMVARSEKAVVKAAKDIGYPVVIKPRQGNKGQGVSVNLKTSRAASRAYEKARRIDRVVVVESFVEGDDFRLLVINGRFIAAVKRIPAHIVGDGQHTVKELMEITNRKERRDGLFLIPLKVENDTKRLLKEQNLLPDSIPENDQVVWLRGAANVSLGGTIEDVTDLVHPDNRAAAILAAETCLLDIAGIDFTSTDIARSWRDGYGKIIEINSGPGVELHTEPTIGSPREVSHHMVRSHFQPQRTNSPPLVVITGRQRKESVAKHCAALWSETGLFPVLLLKDRLVTGADSIQLDKPLYQQMSALERHTQCDAAVATYFMGDLLREGACTDRFTCAVLTDDLVNKKLIGRYHDTEISTRVYALLADLSTNGVVIDGQSKLLQEAVKHLPPDKIVMVWPEPFLALPLELKNHLDRGGRGLGLRLNEEGGNILTWFYNKSLEDIITAPDIQANKLESIMMAIAAVLVSTTSITQLQPILGEYTNKNRKPSSNSLVKNSCPKRGVRIACAVPGDHDAMNTFCQDLRKENRLFLVASDKPAMAEEWKPWKNELEAHQIYYMLEAEHGNASSSPAQYFSSLKEAWQQALRIAKKNDTVLLLTQEYAVRRQFISNGQQQTRTSHHNVKPRLWPAELLAELFQGTWVNGPPSGWGVDRIGWGKNMIGHDMITILPGTYPEKSEDIALMEHDMEEAFFQGGHAAISSVLSNILPRWKAVMQADEPFGGLLRLAEYARHRFKGLVISLATSKDNKPYFFEQAENYFSHQTDHDVYFSRREGDKSLDDATATALAIANTPPQHTLNIFQHEITDPLIGRILCPDVVIFDGTNLDAEVLITLSTYLIEKALIFVFVNPEEEDLWHTPVTKPVQQTRVIISSTQGNDHTPYWAQVLTAISEYRMISEEMNKKSL